MKIASSISACRSKFYFSLYSEPFSKIVFITSVLGMSSSRVAADSLIIAGRSNP